MPTPAHRNFRDSTGPRSRRLGWLTAVLVAAAGFHCSADDSPPDDLCQAAQDHLASCFGMEPTAQPGAVCDERKAEGILSLECSELERADDPNLLCSLGVQSHCEHPPLLPEPSGRPAARPIVLIHGWAASAEVHSFAPNVIAGLEADGHQVFVVTLDPYGTIEVRAEQLRSQVADVLTATGADKAHLIGHSMGGLDARWLACDGGLGQAAMVSTVTSIATPHHGSPLADAAVSVSPPEGLLTWIGSLGLGAKGNFDLPSIAALTTDATARMNEQCVDHPDVTYLSYAGVASVNQITFQEAEERQMCGVSLRHPGSAAIVTPTFQGGAPVVSSLPSDAVVAVNSAAWGELTAVAHMGGTDAVRVGEANFLGCVPGDHGTVVGREADFLDRKTGYEPATFWRHHAHLLAELDVIRTP